MTYEVGRRLVGGVWVTDVLDESSGGGSLPDPSGEPDGDVLTVASGVYVLAPGGGGSTPVSVLLYWSADTAPAAVYPLEWTDALDDFWNQNSLAVLPAGLGLTVAFDGTDAQFTVTEDGIWTFAFIVQSDSADSTWKGILADGISAQWNLNAKTGTPLRTTESNTLALPAGATFTPQWSTSTPPFGGVDPPYPLKIWLTVARIGG